MRRRRFKTKKRTLVKVGGARLRTDADLDQLAQYVQNIRSKGEQVVVVHGGGPEISELHERFDEPFVKRDGLRVTSDKGMDLTTMVLCGMVNKRVSSALVHRGLPAAGISGIDSGMLRAQFLDSERFGRVGTEVQADISLIDVLLRARQVPIVAPVSMGPDGLPVNVNADEAAHALAVALRVDSLEFVSDIPGIKDHSDTVIPTVRTGSMNALIQNQIVTGGMVPKLKAAVGAIRSGVGRVRIGDLVAMDQNTATVVR